MIQLTKFNIKEEVAKGISEILQNHFAEDAKIEAVFKMIGGGTNDQNHVVVRTAPGKQYGLKTRSRGGGPEGERSEEAFSKACGLFELKEACVAVCVDNIPGLDGFDKDICVLTGWVSESKEVGELTPDEISVATREIENIVCQIARWIAVDLHLGLVDRHLKNGYGRRKSDVLRLWIRNLHGRTPVCWITTVS